MIGMQAATSGPVRFTAMAILLAICTAALPAQQRTAQDQPPSSGAQPPARGQGRGPAGGSGRRGAQPQRDNTTPTGTAVITGRVIVADTGRPLRRARVVVGGGRPHATSTDE